MSKKRIAGLVALCLFTVSGVACSSNQKSAVDQQVKVSRGDIVLKVNGNGNVQASSDVKLTFPNPGKIDRIFVKEGDEVTQGKVVARMDTGTLELSRTQAQVSLTQAKLALIQAQLAQQTAEYELSRLKDTKDALELALLTAQINVRSAKYSLDKAQETYKWPEVEAAQSDVDKAKSYVEYVNDNLAKASTPAEMEVWTSALIRAQAALDASEAKLKAQVEGYDPEEVAIKKMQLDAADKAQAQAQKNLGRLNDDLTIKQAQVNASLEAVEQARQAIPLAQQSLDQTQKKLDEANLTAPFNGIIALKSASEGDTVTPANVILRLVDPSKLELVAEYDEIDVPGIKPGQEVVITVDALPGESYQGKVVSIYPVPDTVGGVVFYNIKVSLDVPAGSNLKVGMSASADITTNKKAGILLVPNRALGAEAQGKARVRVLVEGQAQDRDVVTGISDGTYTEIVSGLNEGDLLLVSSSGTTPASK